MWGSYSSVGGWIVGRWGESRVGSRLELIGVVVLMLMHLLWFAVGLLSIVLELLRRIYCRISLMQFVVMSLHLHWYCHVSFPSLTPTDCQSVVLADVMQMS